MKFVTHQIALTLAICLTASLAFAVEAANPDSPTQSVVDQNYSAKPASGPLVGSETGTKEKNAGRSVTDKKGKKFDRIVSRHALANDVPVELAHAIIRIESNYRADALGAAGEVGLMQIKPATARLMGYSGSSKGLFHPETNIKYGMKYLGKARKLGGRSLCGTILKYNAGHGAKRMNPISARYCDKVKREMAQS